MEKKTSIKKWAKENKLSITEMDNTKCPHQRTFQISYKLTEEEKEKIKKEAYDSIDLNKLNTFTNVFLGIPYIQGDDK